MRVLTCILCAHLQYSAFVWRMRPSNVMEVFFHSCTHNTLCRGEVHIAMLCRRARRVVCVCMICIKCARRYLRKVNAIALNGCLRVCVERCVVVTGLLALVAICNWNTAWTRVSMWTCHNVSIMALHHHMLACVQHQQRATPRGRLAFVTGMRAHAERL